MSIAQNLIRIKQQLPSHVTLISISKTQPNEAILEVYKKGHKLFGENKVQELVQKHQTLPHDIEWHMVGHLQSNKVKYIAPFVSLIHSVDSCKLLEEISKQGEKNNRTIKCLLQVHIAKEETKFGFDFKELKELIDSNRIHSLPYCQVVGLMGMATNTENKNQIRSEFKSLKVFFDDAKKQHTQFQILSMGMSSDYAIAIEEGSQMVRIGSTIFGSRG